MAPKKGNFVWSLLDSVEKRRNGIVKGHQYERKLSRLFGRNLRTNSSRPLIRNFRLNDASIWRDRLAVTNFRTSAVIDVSTHVGNEQKRCEYLYSIDMVDDGEMLKCSNPSPCIRWSSEGEILTISGTCSTKNSLVVMDTSTMQIIEKIDFTPYGSLYVFTHEHSPLNPGLIAVGTTNHQLIMVDLKSGNVVVTKSPCFCPRIHGIGWSFSDEHLLVATSPSQALIWDKRRPSKSATELECINNISDHIMPDIKFLDRNRLLIMANRHSVQLHDVYSGHLLHVINDLHYPKCCQNLKFALNRDANTVYFAKKKRIVKSDLLTNKTSALPNSSHLYPVEMLYFNDYTKELYSLNNNFEANIWTPF